MSQIAREVGLTPRGLQKFLDGAEPRSRTRQKLERWFVREQEHIGTATDEITATAALNVLMHDLPPVHRKKVLTQAVSWWENTFTDVGVPLPPWLVSLRQRVAQSSE